ncbi:MAG: hypothetical protein JST60_06770 [Chloroflexi bacterium SZAS-1]|jgi:hypothetical protein|nr:hypothetical protein [Chloroflexi bacterium SZAS-1]HNP86074.1 hypothetical protein [Kouleothrix sp.]
MALHIAPESQNQRPTTDGWRTASDRVLISLHYTFASTPFWAALILIMVAGRARWILGHTAYAALDDPLEALPHDHLTTLFQFLVDGTLSAAILSIILIPISVIVLPNLITVRHQIRVFTLFVLSWILFLFLPRLCIWWFASY